MFTFEEVASLKVQWGESTGIKLLYISRNNSHRYSLTKFWDYILK